MTSTNPLEDERGVDLSQIRRQLALTPAERLDQMVATANMWAEILESAGRSRESQ